MKIQGHLQDYPLPVLLEVLADRRESGCLRIAFEPEPAVLHFNEGQLVDAQIALLRGSAAINLALTMEQAPFDFDNEIILPHSVIDSQERAILSRLLGMRLNVGDDGETEARPAITPYKTESKPISRPNLIRTAAVLLIVAVTAAVGLIVLFSRNTVPAPANAASGKPKPAVDLPATIPVLSGSTGINSPPAAAVEPARARLTAPDKPTVNPTGSKDLEPTKMVGESEPSKVISEVTKVKEEARLNPDSPSTPSSVPESRLGPTAKTIVVEVQIEQGRVTGAWVKNPRKGQEAFEAAAVRIIRQRRYSKQLTGSDSVAVDVTINR